MAAHQFGAGALVPDEYGSELRITPLNSVSELGFREFPRRAQNIKQNRSVIEQQQAGHSPATKSCHG